MFIDKYINYLRYEKRSSEHTLTAYQKDLIQFLRFQTEQFNGFDILKTEYEDVRGWIIELVDSGISPRSVNRKLATLSSFFKFLQKEGFVENNPIDKVQTLKHTAKLPAFIKKNEVEILFDRNAFSNDFNGLRAWMILEILYGTGMRRSELVNLKVDDFDLVNRQVKVLGKRNKERIIPITNAIAELLPKYLEVRKFTNCPYLIVTQKGVQAYSSLIYNEVRKYLRAYTTAEVKSPHTLRHSFATHLLNEGADLNAIKDLLGHANLAATQVYTHNSLERLKKVYQKAHPKSE